MNSVPIPQEQPLTEDPDRLEERIRIAWTRERWAEMASLCEQLRARFPGLVTGYSLEAVALREGGRLDEAAALVESALTQFPEDLSLWVERARIEFGRGQLTEAAERWRAVREQFPAHPEGYCGGAQTLLRAGLHEEAEAVITSGCERLADSPEVLIQSAFVAIERHDWDTAQHRWELVQSRFPQREEAPHWLKQVPLLRALEESDPPSLEEEASADRSAPRVACIMMQKDEDLLLEPWLAYHGYLFGFENLIVYDNGSTSQMVDTVLRRYAAAGVTVIRDKSSADDFINKGWILSAKIRELQRRRKYDIVFPLDCDEFVCITSRDGFSCSRAEINRYLANLEPGNVYLVARSLTNQPGSSTVFRLMSHGKSVISLGRFKLMDHGFHQAELEGVTEYRPTRLVNIHMHNKPFATLLEHARLKLRPFVAVDDPEALARFDGCGVHLKRYFSVTEAQYRGETGPWPLVRFTGFARLLSVLMDFATFEAAWCGTDAGSSAAEAPPEWPAAIDIDGTFDARSYLEANPDAEQTGLDPIIHYLEVRRREGRPPQAVHEVDADSVLAVIPSRDDVLAEPNIECLEAAEVWTRPAADFVVDLSGMSLDHYLSEVQRHERHGTYRNRFNDVLLFGHHHFHGLISGGERIDCQVSDSVREMVDIHIGNHPGRELPIPQIFRDRQGYRLSCAAVRPTEITGTVHFGTPTEPLNWGLWLLQGIPSAMDFRCNRTAERFFAFIERDWQRRLLNTLGIPDEALVHQELCQTYHCESVVLNQYTNLDLVPSAREKEIFQRVARELAGVRAARPRRRIFVSRRSITQQSNGRYRALQNEDALLGALAARNYDIVEPELLAFPEQVRLFAEAELVVGLGGAGLFNVVFCAPGTRVVSIESSTSFVHSHALMFGGLGHPFGIIFGRQDLTDETPVQKRWSLDVAGVIRALQRYERG